MLRGKSKSKIGRRRSSAHQSESHQSELPLLDKKDEIWCYVLIKLFTTILEDPAEAERLLKPTKSAFDIDLQPAVQQLKAAIEKKKSETSQVYDALKNASSILSSRKALDQEATKADCSDDSSSRSSSSSSTISSSGSSDDDGTFNSRSAPHSIWTQKLGVGDSLKELASSAARSSKHIRMEEVIKLVNSLKSGKY